MCFSGGHLLLTHTQPAPSLQAASASAWLCLGWWREREGGLPLASGLLGDLGTCVPDLLTTGQTAGKAVTCEDPFSIWTDVSFLSPLPPAFPPWGSPMNPPRDMPGLWASWAYCVAPADSRRT